MRIIIDGDACPVVTIVEDCAKNYQIELIIIVDPNHFIESKYGKVIVVDQGNDSVDNEIIKQAKKGDIVITQDYALAGLLLLKEVIVIHQNGIEYTNDNIDQMLNARYITKKIRTSNQKIHLKGPKKRSETDNKRFKELLVSKLGK